MKKYTGGCHCGKIKFEVNTDIINKVMSCNCSICSKKGHLLTFVPENNFKLLTGENDLSDYQFGKKQIHHLFCSSCGISSFGKGVDPNGNAVRAINARCLNDLDISTLTITQFDGKSL